MSKPSPLVMLALVAISVITAIPPMTLYGDLNCGRANSDPNRVVFGTETSPNEFPWQVLVEPIFSGQEGLCGGTLLERDLVLTAAHCFYRLSYETAFQVRITLGGHNRSQDITLGTAVELYLPVNQSVLIHPDYVYGKHSKDDIALIFLGHHLDLTRYNNTILPVCLASPSTDLTGREGVVSGWGKTKQHGTTSQVLRKAWVQVVEQAACAQQYKNTKQRVEEGILCAIGEGSRDTCKGDSGGPLAIQDYGTGK